ncbi:MAG: YicC family protein [Acidobacteria bacterium]|nr:YicC family protein [Acidobacteriota bacterium]
MIKSMTGFGRGTYQSEEFTIGVVTSTVNHRFTDIQLRLPEELAAAEPQVRALVQSYCQRGRINVTVTVEQTRDIAYELNRPMIRGYLAALDMMKNEFAISGEIDINTIASLPNVIQSVANLSGLEEALSSGLEAAFKQALQAVVEMRTVEGRGIAREMAERLDVIEKNLSIIERDARAGVELARERLQRRVHDLAADVNIDESRLAQEVVLLAQRADISEEISRLKSHIEQYRSILESEEPGGRKLEFLLQEMNREGTTIQAKSSGLAISKAAIEIRTEIEKLREQVQNVE